MTTTDRIAALERTVSNLTAALTDHHKLLTAALARIDAWGADVDARSTSCELGNRRVLPSVH